MATKKFSPAQIAAQKLFAERARAGTLGKGKRKANPGLYDNINSKRARIAAGSGERMRKPGSKGAPTQEAFEQSAMTAKRNPDKSKPRAYVKRASQITGAPPSKRLVTRRKMALKAPAGYFPNPEPSHDFARIGKPFAFDGRTWKVSQYSHNGKTIEAYTTDRKKFIRREFDVSELMSSRRKTNPAAAMMTGYQVICMHPKKHVVGIFKTMAEAKMVATALANAKGVPYAVKTVRVHKSHFAI